VLSGGILDSEWCIKELRSAIKYNKKLVIVREYTFRLPHPLPPHLADLESVFLETPTFTWIAEYHNNCVAKLKASCLGPPDAVIDMLKEYVRRNNIDIASGEVAPQNHLRIYEWSETLTSFFQGFVNNISLL
jgi:hypothetical protein